MKLNLHDQYIADIAESEVPERHLQGIYGVGNRFPLVVGQKWKKMIHADAVPETSNIYTSWKITLECIWSNHIFANHSKLNILASSTRS